MHVPWSAEYHPVMYYFLSIDRFLSKKFGVTIRRSSFLTKERKTKCRGLFHDYYAGALERLQGMAKETRRVLASNRHQMFTKGEVHPERREKAEQLTAACKKFHETVTLLAEVVDRDPPPPINEMIAGELSLCIVVRYYILAHFFCLRLNRLNTVNIQL